MRTGGKDQVLGNSTTEVARRKFQKRIWPANWADVFPKVERDHGKEELPKKSIEETIGKFAENTLEFGSATAVECERLHFKETSSVLPFKQQVFLSL